MKSYHERVIITYYNVIFCLLYQVPEDEYKVNCFIERVKNGEKLMMKDILEWCIRQQIEFSTRFLYRRDFTIKANLWNYYSYLRFKKESVEVLGKKQLKMWIL